MKIKVINYYEPASGRALAKSSEENIYLSFEKLILSSIYVGRRPNDILTFGKFSQIEIIYRAAIIAANIRQEFDGFEEYCTHTEAFRWLDPSEKASVTYFLGMTVAHSLAAEKIKTPFLLHLDVYTRQNPYGYQLPPVRLSSSARPDLIGVDASGRWTVFETKGRTHTSNGDLRQKMKNQVKSVADIGGTKPTFRYGVCANLGGERLSIDLVDPEESSDQSFSMDIDADIFRLASYKNIASALFENPKDRSGDELVIYIESADIFIHINKDLADALEENFTFKQSWGYAPNLDYVENNRMNIRDLFLGLEKREMNEEGYGSLGVGIRLGKEWQ